MRITEQDLNREAAVEIEVKLPKGVSPSQYIEETFGAQLATPEDMLDDADVDFSCELKFVK